MNSLITKEDNKLTIATRLHAIEREISLLEEDKRVLRDELLSILKKSGLKGIKLETGEWYVRTERTTLKVKKGHENEASKWAEFHNALKIDTATAWKILRREMKLPKFFTKSTTEFLQIKRGNEQSDE